MLKRILTFIQHRTSGGSILGLLSGTLLLMFLMNGTQLPFSNPTIQEHSGGLHILDMQGSYTPDDAYALFGALGEAGRRAYLMLHLGPDTLFPIGYALTFAFVSAWFLVRLLPLDHAWQWLSLMPLISGLADELENGLLTTANLMYPDRMDGLVQLAQWMTRIKFGLAPIGLIFLGVIVGAWFVRGRPRSNVPGGGVG